MNIENLWVNKVSQVNVTAETKRPRSDKQSKNSFSEVLKKASAKVGSKSIDNALSGKNPFSDGMGNA